MLNPFGVPFKKIFSFDPRVKTRGYQHIAPTGQRNFRFKKNSSSYVAPLGGQGIYLSISGITRSIIAIIATRSPIFPPLAI
jgi:hypothetical protein